MIQKCSRPVFTEVQDDTLKHLAFLYIVGLIAQKVILTASLKHRQTHARTHIQTHTHLGTENAWSGQ